MKKAMRIIIPVVIIALGVGAYLIWGKSKEKAEWKMMPVDTGTLKEVVTATGTISAENQVDVGTEVSGKIVKLYKDFNDQVKKGDLLAKLDTDILERNLDDAQSNLEKAQTSVADAKLDYDNAEEMLKKQLGSAYDRDKAKNKYESAMQDLGIARSDVDKARKNLNKATITSPIDGVIVSREVEEGQTVAASQNVPTLYAIANDLEKMQIEADVDEADIGKVQIGQKTEFNVDAFPDRTFKGEVRQIRLSPSTTNNVVTYTVIIGVDNSDHVLLPGLTADVTIIIQQKDNVLRVPELAMRFKPSKEIWEQFGLKWTDGINGRQRGQKTQANNAQTTGNTTSANAVTTEATTSHLWVLENGIPQQKSITIGMSDGSYTEVTGGIAAGQQVIVGIKSNKSTTSSSSVGGMGGPGGGMMRPF